jgi:hypothetical protein
LATKILPRVKRAQMALGRFRPSTNISRT